MAAPDAIFEDGKEKKHLNALTSTGPGVHRVQKYRYNL